MRIAYVRVSSPDQNPQRQIQIMEQLGVEKLFTDTISGSRQHRPGLAALLEFVREGDTVIVESISRMARNTKDLLDILDRLSRKGAVFVSQKESIDTATPAGQFMLTVFAAVAQLERDYLLQRQKEGIHLAKRSGKYRGRTPIPVDPSFFDAVYHRWRAGEITAVRAQKELGLSPSTFYRRVRARENR